MSLCTGEYPCVDGTVVLGSHQFVVWNYSIFLPLWSSFSTKGKTTGFCQLKKFYLFNTDFQIMQVKQVPTISREGALLITNRKISMFATVICTMIIALFQLITALIGMAEKGLRPLSDDPDFKNHFKIDRYNLQV